MCQYSGLWWSMLHIFTQLDVRGKLLLRWYWLCWGRCLTSWCWPAPRHWRPHWSPTWQCLLSSHRLPLGPVRNRCCYTEGLQKHVSLAINKYTSANLGDGEGWSDREIDGGHSSISKSCELGLNVILDVKLASIVLWQNRPWMSS